MKYCKKCTMPDTRPGITFDAEGVCSACRHYESRSKVDWDARWKEFEALCDKYRGMNGPGGYDCAVAVSGGKDSHFQVYILKEVMKMNPILFSVEDNFPMTEAGKHNLKNISEAFGCTIISCKPNIKAQKTLMRAFFEKYGKPTWYVDRLIYTFPLHMALKFNTPLLCYGENVSFEYGGNADEETYSARGQIENGVAVGFPTEELLGVRGVCCTPHLGASTPESETNCAVMAAAELSDYLKNGNITHSVNLPDVSQPRIGGRRICMIHKNTPGAISAITGVLTEAHLNIENMVNKSKKDVAYTLLDVTGNVTGDLAVQLRAIESAIRVRVL